MPLGLYSLHPPPRRALWQLACLLLCLTLAACTLPPRPMEASSEHLAPPPSPALAEAPPLADLPPLPPPPVAKPETEHYTVVVNSVPAQEILFALARDAKLNIEIHPDISGTVTMNLIDQTLTEILDAISRQIDMRYEINGKNLAIMPDSPFLKIYQIDYPNVTRNAENSISTSTNVAAMGQSNSTSTGGNESSSSIKNVANNHFWETLIENIKDLLRETDKTLPDGASQPALAAPQTTPLPTTALPPASAVAQTGPGQTPLASTQAVAAPLLPAATAPARVSYREAASVIANPESGTISVRATARQQASVREFIDRVMASARRQVLIEATIVEVSLTDQYQQGIDWSLLNNTSGWNFTRSATPASLFASPIGTITYDKIGAQGGRFDLSASIKLLETFGKLHVLSSPKLSVLNNQTSLLKVVDESVYFTIEVTPGTISEGVVTPPTYSSNVHTLPVGFLMYVTPQIGNDAEVVLNLRPTISRITSYAKDPNPVLAQNNITNLIPQIQTREMESILRVRNGDIAVLGGLMQDSRSGDTNQLPLAGDFPGLGELFKARNDTNSKSELVIFLRPIILEGEGQSAAARLFNNSAGTAELQRPKLPEKATP